MVLSLWGQTCRYTFGESDPLRHGPGGQARSVGDGRAPIHVVEGPLARQKKRELIFRGRGSFLSHFFDRSIGSRNRYASGDSAFCREATACTRRRSSFASSSTFPCCWYPARRRSKSGRRSMNAPSRSDVSESAPRP